MVPNCFEKANPVSIHDQLDVGFLVASVAQERTNFLQVSNGIQIVGAALQAIATVKIATDRGMPGVPGELTDMIDVVDVCLQADYGVRGLADDPSGIKHHVLATSSNNRTSLDKMLELLVSELATARNERATVIVAGKHRTLKLFDRLPKAFIG